MARRRKASTIYMETTEIDSNVTIGEIQAVLSQHGLRQFNMVYDEEGEVEGVFFTLNPRGIGIPEGLMDQVLPYKLPIRHEHLLKLAEEKKTNHLKAGDVKQARRIAWRQILRWVEAQMALVNLNMVSTAEVFLPYMMVDGSKKTVFEKMVEANFNLPQLTEGKKS